VDATNHRLFVADSSNNRILEYNLTTGNIPIDRIPDAVLGQPNFYSNASATTQAAFNSPMGLTFDSAGNKLYVADNANHRILVFDTSNISNGMNAVGVLGQPSFIANASSLTQLGLRNPSFDLYDTNSAQLFVTDAGNNRVVIYGNTTPNQLSGSSSSQPKNSFNFIGF